MSSTETTETTDSAESAASPLADDRVLFVTEAAHAHVVGIRDAEEDGNTLGLRVEITGTRGPEFAYELSFASLADAPIDDHIEVHAGLRVLIPGDQVADLRGAVLDLPDDLGLVIRNPNRPRLAALEGLDLDGPLATSVQGLLADQINPALAAHGGFVELAGVDDTDVYLRMGGGCQGCAMSRQTMMGGVEATLRSELPEITRVLDVTDHSAGENPYYS